MDDWHYLCNRRADIRQRALANRYYYQERQRIFELREGGIKLMSLLTASVAFVKVADPKFVVWLSAALAGSTLASLIFAFGKKARDSEKRHTEWALLERDMEERGERTFSEGDLNKWAARCNELEAGEPAPHPGLFCRCDIRACKALGSRPAAYPFWMRVRPHILIP